VEVDVDAVEADKEVDKGLFLLSGNVGEEGRRDGLTGGERLVDGDVEDKSFGVDVADVDATFVCEEDRVAFALGVNTDIILGVGRMGLEGLDDKVV